MLRTIGGAILFCTSLALVGACGGKSASNNAEGATDTGGFEPVGIPAPRGGVAASTGGSSNVAGGSSSTAGASWAPASVGGSKTLGLPFDTSDGCRDFASAGCERCCLPGVDHTGAAVCNIWQLNSSSSVAGACPADCPPCAGCTASTEQSLLNAAANPRTDCNCPTVDTGGDPCIAPTECGCCCVNFMASLAACPQLGTTACGNGNHCGLELLVKPGPYHPGDTVSVYWLNLGSSMAYVANCGSFDILRWDSVSQVTVAPASPCLSPGVTMIVPPNMSASLTSVTLPSNAGGGFFVFHTTYYLGCGVGAPDAGSCAAGPIDIDVRVDVYAQ